MDIVWASIANLINTLAIYSVFNYLFKSKKLPNHNYLKWFAYYFLARGTNVSLRALVEVLSGEFFIAYTLWYSFSLVFLLLATTSYAGKKFNKNWLIIVLIRAVLVIIGLGIGEIFYYMGILLSLIVYIYAIYHIITARRDINKDFYTIIPGISLNIIVLFDIYWATFFLNEAYFILSGAGILALGLSLIINHLQRTQIERDEAVIENNSLKASLASIDRLEHRLKTLAASCTDGRQ